MRKKPAGLRPGKLTLDRETLRVLTEGQLHDAAGGSPKTTQCPTVNLAICESILPTCYCVPFTYGGCTS
jgi:hypothetical protein